MKSVIIVEGENDKLLVERVLQHSKGHRPDTTVFVAGGQSAAESLGISLVATRHIPVALILDSDTNNDDAINEKRSFLEASLRSVSPNVPWLVILMIPELEVVFFRDLQLLRAILGPAALKQRKEGLLAPKKTLHTILSTHGIQYREFVKQRLSKTALSKLANMQEFCQLQEFIEDPYRRITEGHPLHRRQ